MTTSHWNLFTFITLLYFWTQLEVTNGQFGHKYNVIVQCSHGAVEGFSIPSHYEAYDKQRINVFLGVPYAKRISEYPDWRRQFRFNKPERPSWSGIWDATKYRPACPQIPWYVRQTVPNFHRSRDTSEDCLYMNIFVPNKTDERPVSNPPLYPVMVFIHGGGWTMGASQQYPGVFLAERKVVVVTFNYRLNALGFMSTGDNYSPGNYGLWDQQRALEFVKENIRYFRGNPGMVTIFGHSTGAASVGMHLLSPRSYNLFHQAIMMSGSDRCQWSHIPDINDAKQYAQNLARELGCPSNDNQRLVTCMQLYRTADEIVNASVRVRVKEGTVGNPWGPVVDGPFMGSVYAFLLDSPKAMRQQGRYQKLRVMGGLLKDDGSYYIRYQCTYPCFPEVFLLPVLCTVFFPSHWLLSHISIIETVISGEGGMNLVAMTIEVKGISRNCGKGENSANMPSLEEGIEQNQFDNVIVEFLRDRSVADMTNAKEALTFEYSYWPQRQNRSWIRQELIDMMTDYLFGTGMDESLRAQNLYNKTYFYVFNYKSRYDYMPTWRGIAHGQELQYVFGFPYINETYVDIFGVYPRQEYDMDFSDRNISEYMISLFTNFSDSGNPTDGKFFVKNFRNVSWLEYNLQNHSYLEINNQSSNKINYRQRQYGFWREYFVAVSNRDPLFGTTPEPIVEQSNDFKIATIALAILSGLLIFLVVALGIAICRMRPRDY